MIDSQYRYLPCSYPSSLEAVQTQNGELTAKAIAKNGGGFHLSAAAVAPNVLRIRLYQNDYKAPLYSFVEPLPPLGGCVVQDGAAKIETGQFTAEFTLSPFSFTVYDKNRRPVYEELLNDVNSVGDGLDIIPPMGFSHKDGAVRGANICAKLRYDEHIFGLGEHFTEYDKRGQKIDMWNFDTLGCRDEHSYKNIPFYISSNGYGLLVNSCLAAQFCVGCESNAAISVHAPGDTLEYYIITADTPKEILSRYTELTGAAAMPPAWSFGLWYSTGFKGTTGEAVLKDAAILREKKAPCDVIHFDCFWLRDDMWCDFVWDEKLYPNHVEMLKSLHRDGFKICLWINPYVTITSPMFSEGDRAGFFIKRADGSTYTADMWHSLLSCCAILDVTNPAAELWFKQKVLATLSEGVDVLKTDFGEDIPVDSVFFNGKTGEEMRNIYSNLYNTIVFDAVKQHGGTGLVWGRSGTAGMQKFPVCWSGDPRSCFEGMAGTLRAGLSMAMSGVPFWSHDIGGFYGEVSPEVLIRWAQFGLFSSHSRLHGTSSRQPWAYDKRTEDILVSFIRLRYKLMPYILKTARAAVQNGLPFIRPLWLEHPDDPTTLTISDEYYFGESIIVAPVFGGDNAKRKVYLPEGEWEHLLSGEVYSGKCWHSFICPLETLPVFKKRGHIIELQE